MASLLSDGCHNPVALRRDLLPGGGRRGVSAPSLLSNFLLPNSRWWSWPVVELAALFYDESVALHPAL